MNKKIILGLAFFATLFVTSCKKELQPQDSSETPATETAVAPENPIEVTPQAPTSSTQVAPQPAQQSTTVAPTAPGMNPPHGQPGHRCDIAVGAPLNSPKATAPAAHNVPKTANLEPVTSKTTLSQPVATETAPGMNPPHGQPGHRCEIAVGAPLPTE